MFETIGEIKPAAERFSGPLQQDHTNVLVLIGFADRSLNFVGHRSPDGVVFIRSVERDNCHTFFFLLVGDCLVGHFAHFWLCGSAMALRSRPTIPSCGSARRRCWRAEARARM